MEEKNGIRVFLSEAGFAAQINGPQNSAGGLLTRVDLDAQKVYVLRDGFAAPEWFDCWMWVVPDGADLGDVTVILRAA